MYDVQRIEKRLQVAKHKIQILEDMLENSTRDLYISNQELQKKNKELEQFAFITSHDLQEPLRTVTNYTDILDMKYGGHFDELGNKSIHFISEATARMSQMINSLLDHSRIGFNQKLELTDSRRIIVDIQNDLATTIAKTNTKLSISKLPEIKCYQTELRQLFQNLILNAIKFCKADISPHISITAKEENTYWKFAIRDNGIGIAEKYRERIFTIFQRLHERGQYQGIGIGLANCQKIVALHGGKIWVDSEPDEGSTFYFTILNQ